MGTSRAGGGRGEGWGWGVGWAGPVQWSAEKDQSSCSGKTAARPFARTWRHRASQGGAVLGLSASPGAELQARTPPRILRGQDLCSAARKDWSLCSASISPFLHLPTNPPVGVGVGVPDRAVAKTNHCQDGRRGGGAEVTEIPAPPQVLLTRLQAWRPTDASSLPLSCGPARPATCSLESRSGLSSGERSPATRAVRAAPSARPAASPLPPRPRLGRRGVVQLSLPLLPPRRRQLRPAPAGFIKSPLPRVKRRVVRKSPQGRGRV